MSWTSKTDNETVERDMATMQKKAYEESQADGLKEGKMLPPLRAHDFPNQTILFLNSELDKLREELRIERLLTSRLISQLGGNIG